MRCGMRQLQPSARRVRRFAHRASRPSRERRVRTRAMPATPATRACRAGCPRVGARDRRRPCVARARRRRGASAARKKPKKPMRKSAAEDADRPRLPVRPEARLLVADDEPAGVRSSAIQPKISSPNVSTKRSRASIERGRKAARARASQQREHDERDADALAADQQVVHGLVRRLAAAPPADRLHRRLAALWPACLTSPASLRPKARPPPLPAAPSAAARLVVQELRYGLLHLNVHRAPLERMVGALERPQHLVARALDQRPRSRPYRRSRARRLRAGSATRPCLLVHRQDDDDHAVGREMLAVAQDDVVDVADAEAVDVDVVRLDAFAVVRAVVRSVPARRRR